MAELGRGMMLELILGGLLASKGGSPATARAAAAGLTFRRPARGGRRAPGDFFVGFQNEGQGCKGEGSSPPPVNEMNDDGNQRSQQSKQ